MGGKEEEELKAFKTLRMNNYKRNNFKLSVSCEHFKYNLIFFLNRVVEEFK